MGNYYSKEESQNIFDELEIGMNILKFEEMSYCKKRKIVTSKYPQNYPKKSKLEISGTRVRELILSNENIPNYILDESVLKELRNLIKTKNNIFESEDD